MRGTPVGEPLLLRIGEAAAMCGISWSLLYQMISAGQIPTVHIGRACRVPRAWLETWVAGRVADWERGVGQRALGPN